MPCWHLAEAASVIEKHPEIPVVVNHLGFPWDRSDDGLAFWRDQMRAIARLPWVHLKVSGGLEGPPIVGRGKPPDGYRIGEDLRRRAVHMSTQFSSPWPA